MGNDRRRSISPATTSPTSFYKIILPSVMHCHRLRVPEEFSKKYGNELSNLVKFTVHSGQVCHVGVEKADKMLWFTDGWKESENHSIGCGFCVVFNYEGNSKFKIASSHKGESGSNDIVRKLSCRPSRPTLVSLENGIIEAWGFRFYST